MERCVTCFNFYYISLSTVIPNNKRFTYCSVDTRLTLSWMTMCVVPLNCLCYYVIVTVHLSLSSRLRDLSERAKSLNGEDSEQKYSK